MKARVNFIAAAIALATALAIPGRALADQQFYSTRSLLTDFFPDSDRVTYLRYRPDASERHALHRELGYPLPRDTYVFFVAQKAGAVVGYALVDDQKGQHEPITFAVKLSPTGVVLRQEVMVYREQRGAEIRDPRFRRQFVGKAVTDPVRAGVDIDTVSGATISSVSMATGVRRALVLFRRAVTQAGPTARPGS